MDQKTGGRSIVLFDVLGEREKFKEKIKENRRDPPLSKIIEYLGKKPTFDSNKLKTISFLIEYRNTWHVFGHYTKDDCDCKDIKLEKGKPVPIIGRLKRIEFLQDFFDIFLQVNALRSGTP